MAQDHIRENNFNFTFEKIPGVAFACQTMVLPSIAMGVMEVPTTQVDFQVPGSKLIKDPLSFEFMVDEDLGNYRSILNWFNEMRDPRSTKWQDKMSDCTLEILTNQKNHLVNVDFQDCFPSQLSELRFDYTTTDPQPLKATVTIEYSWFVFKD